MTDMLSGIITDACVVTFTGLTGDLKGARVLTGTVVKDFVGRFRAGDAFVSSRIHHVFGDIMQTQNSTYQVQGPVDHVDLPSQAISLVRALIDPREILQMLELAPPGGQNINDQNHNC